MSKIETGNCKLENRKMPVASPSAQSVIAAALPFAICVLTFDLLFVFLRFAI
jgi:hypothetical protein